MTEDLFLPIQTKPTSGYLTLPIFLPYEVGPTGLEIEMAREYRIELGDRIEHQKALELLEGSPHFHRPLQPFCEGEVWLTTNLQSTYVDVRVFPRAYGFFVEITSLPDEVASELQSWIAHLRDCGYCSILDNDTDEVTETLR
jgi:hypothetical protein